MTAMCAPFMASARRAPWTLSPCEIAPIEDHVVRDVIGGPRIAADVRDVEHERVRRRPHLQADETIVVSPGSVSSTEGCPPSSTAIFGASEGQHPLTGL